MFADVNVGESDPHRKENVERKGQKKKRVREKERYKKY